MSSGESYFDRLRPYIVSSGPNTKGWWDATCPLHDDKRRSAGFNFEQSRWSCLKGCGKGHFDDLLARMEMRKELGLWNGDSTSVVIEEEAIDTTKLTTAQINGLNETRRRQKRPMPSDDLIAKWKARLRSDRKLLDAFREKRGFTLDTIERFEIGWSDDDRAYMLPIRSETGSLVNVRVYRINAQDTKIWSYGSPGMDTSMLFPESVIADNHQLIIAEGEWDAIILNQNGFPAISGTTGAEQWQKKWNRKLKGKDVIIVYDRDRAGDAGGKKVAESLTNDARSISIAELPLEWSEKGGEDVTDFFHVHSKSVTEFAQVLHNATVFTAPKDGAPIEVSVKESFNPKLSGQTMAMTVAVVGKIQTQHLLPHDLVITCNQNAGKLCESCPLHDAGGRLEVEIERHDPLLLKLRDVTDAQRNDAIRSSCGIAKCGRITYNVKSFHSQEILTARTAIDYSIDNEGDITQRAIFNVGEYDTDANNVMRVTGTTHPDPKAQTSIFLSWKSEPVETSLDTSEFDASEISLMKCFVPDPGQSPLNKMKHIAYDLADNITRIVGRPELHMAMDIVWHSAIAFDFAGQPLERGWTELLVVGDARTGKSEVAHKLSRHYGFGRVISCESSSIPGILGAAKNLEGARGWVLEWGVIPINDRKLVVLDEAGGLTIEEIGKLSSVRSSGRAEVHKAAAHQTQARTRLIWLSNPRNNKDGMAAYMYGVRSIQPLIGTQEDIARFDFAMTVTSDDVPLERINSRNADPRPHQYSAAACHTLIRWVWSRKREDVVWDREAEDEVYKAAQALGKQYVPDPPLIQGNDVRMKIARMAVAIAARTFSTDPTFTHIVVKPIHVKSVVTFLNYIYGKDAFGYLEASERAKEEDRLAIDNMRDTKEYLYSRPGLARFLIASNGDFSAKGLQEQLNYNREEGNFVIQKLASVGMIKAFDAFSYRIGVHLNTILREIKEP